MSLACGPCMQKQHTILWIDGHEAKVFHLHDGTFDAQTVERPHHHIHRHPAAYDDRDHPEDAQRYFHDVARAVEGGGDILVVGPSTTKARFVEHVHRHDRALEPKIVGVESCDHPTDPQLVALARRYFHQPAC